MTQATPNDGLRAADRGLSTLRAVALAPTGITLTEIARAVGLPTSTTLRHLRNLDNSGFVTRVGDRYVAGSELLAIAHAVTRAQTWARRAQPALDELAERTGESAYLAEPLDGRWAVYTAMAESRQAIRHVSWLGQRIRRRGSAVGAALAGAVGEFGVAIRNDAVEPGVTAVSAPIHEGDAVVAAISVVGPSFRLHEDVLAGVADALHAAVRHVRATPSIHSM